jgi:hypothetical protein
MRIHLPEAESLLATWLTNHPGWLGRVWADTTWLNCELWIPKSATSVGGTFVDLDHLRRFLESA